jgi:ATP/maltotriose-dependent transcriptional regulator MalT
MAGTLRGFVALQRGDLTLAEADARRVMTAVEPHNPLAPAQVGPRVLLAEARMRSGDAATAIGLLAPIASDTGTSLLFSRRHALASYASALLADGRVDSALNWIERAREVPAEDVRSGVLTAMVHARVLAAADRLDDARREADRAVLLAYSTEQASERVAAEELRDTLASTAVEPSPPETVAYASDLPG